MRWRRRRTLPGFRSADDFLFLDNDNAVGIPAGPPLQIMETVDDH